MKGKEVPDRDEARVEEAWWRSAPTSEKVADRAISMMLFRSSGERTIRGVGIISIRKAMRTVAGRKIDDRRPPPVPWVFDGFGFMDHFFCIPWAFIPGTCSLRVGESDKR